MKSTKLLFILIAGSAVATGAYGQSERRLTVEAGLLARATIMHYRGAKTLSGGRLLNADAPYIFSRGVDGIGLAGAVGVKLSRKHSISIKALTTLRYAFFFFDSDRCADCFQRTVYIDQSVVFTKENLFQTTWYVGAGYSLINIGKDLQYVSGGVEKTLPLHFNSIDLIVGRSIWRLGTELRMSYVDHDFPGRVRTNAELLGIRIYYSIKGSNQKK